MEKLTQFIESISVPKFERKEVLPVISIAAATTLLYASYTLATANNRRKHNKQDIKEIPIPGEAYPYVGHLLSLGELPGKKGSEWHKQLGPIIKLRMGIQSWIMVDEPNLAHKIFVTQGVESSYRPNSIYGYRHYSLGGNGMAFAQPTPGWKKARAAALSVLAPKQIDKYMDSICEESARLVDGFIKSTEKDGSTNPTKYLELNSMNVMFATGYGRKFDSVEDPEFIDLSDIVETSLKFAGLENDMANFLPIASVFDYVAGTQSKMAKFAQTRLDPVFRKLIKAATEAEGPNLVKSLKEEDGSELSDDELRVFMSDLLVGETDTISVTLSWNICIMCHHPEVQKAAAAEIDQFIKLNGHIPLFSDRLELPYCVSVIKECMRYRPTTPFGLPHTVSKDIEVDGYIIPAGATIISNMDSMHKNADIYPDPENFYPERFMDNLKTMLAAANGKLEERDHYNFGWGRRICPAVHLAEVEIFSAFVQILSRCVIEPGASGLPDIDGAKNAGLTLMPLPYKVRFTKRTDSPV